MRQLEARTGENEKRRKKKMGEAVRVHADGRRTEE